MVVLKAVHLNHIAQGDCSRLVHGWRCTCAYVYFCVAEGAQIAQRSRKVVKMVLCVCDLKISLTGRGSKHLNRRQLYRCCLCFCSRPRAQTWSPQLWRCRTQRQRAGAPENGKNQTQCAKKNVWDWTYKKMGCSIFGYEGMPRKHSTSNLAHFFFYFDKSPSLPCLPQ